MARNCLGHVGEVVRWNDSPDRLSTLMIKHPCPKYPRSPLIGDTYLHQVLQHENALVGIVNTSTQRPAEIAEASWRTHLLGAYPADAVVQIEPMVYHEKHCDGWLPVVPRLSGLRRP